MGSCCFTPRRTQFLWWYWLLLASIVGIPMFLACWYVSAHSSASEEEKKSRGRTASFIFWVGTVASATIAILIAWHFFAPISRDTNFAPLFSGWSWLSDFEAFVILLSGFLFGLAVWTSVGIAIYTNSGKRLIIPLVFLLLAVISVPFNPFETNMGDLPVLFAASMAPAHFSANFSLDPTQRTARRALIGFVAGAFLYWAVAKYWCVASAFIYLAVRGKHLDATDIADLLRFNQSRF